MSELNSTFWNDLYKNKETRWDMGEISPPLKAYFDQLEDKSIRILIPGCGNSYEAEYLMDIGFKDVTVVDISEEPIKNLQKRLDNYDGKEIEILLQDFFTFMPDGKFDLVIEQTFFCAIDRSLREEYVQHMHEIIAPGGKLVGVLFKTEFENPGPPFGGSKDEYQYLFSELFEIKKLEDCYNSLQKRAGNELFIELIRK